MSEPKPPASASKNKAFKPRAGIVRKSKAEREAHAKEEAEKAATRAAAAAQVTSKTTPTTKPGTSKKRELPRDNRDNSQGTSQGIFGSGTGASQRSKRSLVDGGRSEVLDGQDGTEAGTGAASQVQESGAGEKRKTTAPSATTGTSGISEGRVAKAPLDGPAFESDDVPREHGRDIDLIWMSSDEETGEEATETGKGKARATSEGKMSRSSIGLRPVRAPRYVPDEQSPENSKGRGARTTRASRTALDDADGHDDGDDMDFDDDQTTHPAHSTNSKHDVHLNPELSRKTKPGRRLGTRIKESKLSAETVEEKAERLRLSEEVKKLREEFMFPASMKANEHIGEGDGAAKPDSKLFLFQFPPLVPFLVDQTSLSPTGQCGRPSKSQLGPRIKNEMEDSMSTAPPEAEDDTSAAPALPHTRMEGMLTADEPIRLPPGRVGKLKLHKSGKVTLDWGGTDMEVRYGTEVDFLQDAVLVETPKYSDDQEDTRSTSASGISYALGPVQKKLVVIPDWQKLYD